MTTTTRSPLATQLETILAEGSITVAFQPIVELLSGATVAYEALCRGPDGSDLAAPEQLFHAARETGLLAEVDWACRATALREALAANIRPPLTLFLNVEPSVTSPAPESAGPVLAQAMSALRVVIELTERELLAHPAQLLNQVETIRYTGWGVAVDDIGAHPHSIALLEVLEPDVVKLDYRLLQEMSSTRAAATVSGVQTYCARSGARIVVEALENVDHVATAGAIHASYGQGWQLGRPAASPRTPDHPSSPLPLINPRPHRPTQRLITLVTRREPPQHLTREAVDRLSHYVVDHAASMGDDVLVVACVQHARYLTGELIRRLEQLSRRVAVVEILGAGIEERIAGTVRGTRLQVEDPLVCEWVIAVIGLQESVALVATDLGDDRDDEARRRYDLAITYEPELVTDVARALLTRVP
jgi:EAL domain-containing protein (putative c-di-GMP-specific phosphodiesterase class I)